MYYGEKFNSISHLVGASLALVGCDTDDTLVDVPSSVPPSVQYTPSEGILPVPNDLLFSGSEDLTLNVPVDNPADTSDPLVALSTLDGWSTVAPLTFDFTQPLDAATRAP